MRAPDPQPIAAGAAALLLVASTAWWVLSTPEVVNPGQPSWKGADIVRLTASVPQIGKFDYFYVNDDNPFVPLQARLAENRSWDRIRNPQTARTRPPAPVQIPPPREPVRVVEPEKPKLVLPKIVPAPSNAPTVYGLVSLDGSDALIVRMAGAKDSIQLVPGTQVDGWTLVSIDNGNLATFTDPQGVEHRFTIGRGDLAVAQETAAANGKGTAAPAAKGGTPPKGPAQGGPVRLPGMQGADGVIPRPPPREERRRRERPQEAPAPQAPPKK